MQPVHHVAELLLRGCICLPSAPQSPRRRPQARKKRKEELVVKFLFTPPLTINVRFKVSIVVAKKSFVPLIYR